MTTGSDGLAGLLSGLKKRSGLSYGALAGRLHVSTSTVHRYCNGDAVPTEFGTIERFAKQCGATRDELVEAHRRWIIADDARRRPRPAAHEPAERPPVTTGTSGTPSAAPDEAAGATGPHSPAPTPAPEDAPKGGALPLTAPEAESEGNADPESGATPAAAPGASGAGATRWSRRGRDASRSAAVGSAARRRGVRIALAAGTVAVLAVPAAYAVTRYAADEPTPSGPSAPVTPSSGRTSPSAPGPGPAASASASAGPTASGSATAARGASPGAGASAPAPGREGSSTPGGTPPSGDGAAVQPPSVGVSSYNWDAPCGENYLLDQPEGQVPPPSAPQDTRGWARALGAVDAGAMRLQLTAKGRAEEAVVITGIDVRVVERGAPLAWRAFSMGDGCGSGITPQTFDIDLDDARPVTRAKDGQDGGTTVPAKGFPFKVSSHDPQVFNLDIHTEGHQASWYLEVGWSSGDRRGTVRVDDGGRPFRTSALEGRPRFGWWPDRSEWVAY
ncbi:helix-turn-helix domain-containing protein [Streptomyces sp. NBC_01426]|uniref:helix-turn-helix domain-containing protein n=1 Tax=Streptomyces sp. NBC_01426 TaxID=2975866 RepID=UPI002E33E8B3|nr:helix-turn-helix domain-containing protein [Streptomyces sp. NBC_01426]